MTEWNWLFGFLLLGMLIVLIWLLVSSLEWPRERDELDDRIDKLERRVDKMQGGIPVGDSFTPIRPTDDAEFTRKAKAAVLIEEASTDPAGFPVVVGPSTTVIPVVTTLKAPNELDRPTKSQEGGPGTTPDFRAQPDPNHYGRHAAPR